MDLSRLQSTKAGLSKRSTFEFATKEPQELISDSTVEDRQQLWEALKRCFICTASFALPLDAGQAGSAAGTCRLGSTSALCSVCLSLHADGMRCWCGRCADDDPGSLTSLLLLLQLVKLIKQSAKHSTVMTDRRLSSLLASSFLAMLSATFFILLLCQQHHEESRGTMLPKRSWPTRS